MDRAVNPASIAISVSVGTALLGGLFSVWVAMGSRNGTAVNRDTAASTLFGVALLLIVFNVVAAAFIAAWGLAYVGLMKAVMLQTAAFALVGIGFGLMRGLRSRRAVKAQGT